MRRRNADSGSYEAIGTPKWIIKAGFALLGTILSALMFATWQELKDQGKDHADLDRRVTRLESHGHPEDPRIVRQIDKLESRVDRIERPRPWERTQRR